MDRFEPKNPNLDYSMSKVFSRLSGRNMAILQHTLTLIERAKQLNSENSTYITDHSYQLLMMNNSKTALIGFKQASKLDESSEPALYGLIKCQIMAGQYEDANRH